MKRFLLVLCAVFPPLVPAASAPRSEAEIVKLLIDTVDLGPARGICIGAAEECRAKQEPRAQPSLDLLVTFDLDSAELTADADRKLGPVAKALQEETLKYSRVMVEGYTDARGTEAHNLGLSRDRAQAVGDFLVRNGVEASRLTIVGRGANDFRTADRFDPINRRVELRLLAP